MNRSYNIRLENMETLTRLGKALYSEARVKILQMLCDRTMSVYEIASAMNIPASSAALHIRELEDADLINVEYMPGVRGSRKMCSVKWDTVNVKITNGEELSPGERTETISIPVGSYFDCRVIPTCGIVNEQGYIGADDDPAAFFLPGRMTAQLIWTGGGYLEYRVPLTIDADAIITGLEVSAELCSEAPNSRNDWKSDITLWINGTETATYTSPSDFGERRGRLTPMWWSDLMTQHGELITFSVNENGSEVNGKNTTDVNLKMLKLDQKRFFTVRFGIKEQAENDGGMNIFGERFGDFNQDILVSIRYKMP